MDREWLEHEINRNPFDTFMQFHVAKAEQECTVLTFENKGSKWDNPNGTMYGGVLYSMADSAMEAACAVHGKAVLTLDLGMNYLRPALPTRSSVPKQKSFTTAVRRWSLFVIFTMMTIAIWRTAREPSS